MSKLGLSTRTSVNAANQDYDKITDSNAATPSAPVHAARLNGLLKTLANAEGAVTEIIKARNALIKDLEQLLKVQSDEVGKDEAQLKQLSERRVAIDAKKKDVEDAIMRGFATNSNPGSPAVANSPGRSHSPVTPAAEPDRPEVEALTPPTHSPKSPKAIAVSPPGNGQSLTLNSPPPAQPLATSPPPPPPTQTHPAAAGLDLLASLSSGGAYSPSNGSSAKKRKLTSDDDFPDLGGDVMDDIDDDVAEMLRSGA